MSICLNRRWSICESILSKMTASMVVHIEQRPEARYCNGQELLQDTASSRGPPGTLVRRVRTSFLLLLYPAESVLVLVPSASDLSWSR